MSIAKYNNVTLYYYIYRIFIIYYFDTDFICPIVLTCYPHFIYYNDTGKLGDIVLINSENEKILNSYKPLLDYLTAAFGPQKAVLYEINPETNESRAVLCKFPEISIGDDLGPVGKQVLLNSKKGYNYLIYSEKDEESKSREKLAYYLIRNSQDAVIGILLVVLEIDHLLKLKKSLDQLLGFTPIDNRPVEFNDLYHELETEKFSLSKYVSELISDIIEETAIPVGRMTMDEKAQILHRLEKLEIFNLKGSVKEATTQLMISPATLYRLLKRE